MVRGKVIRDKWSEFHRPVANSTMTGYVRIYAPDSLAYDEAARMDVPTPGVIRWEGMCRAQQHNFESTYVVGDQTIRSRAHLIAIPAQVENVQINDVARFETDHDPAMLEMLIVSIQKGSERWQRDLTGLDRAQLNLEQAHG